MPAPRSTYSALLAVEPAGVRRHREFVRPLVLGRSNTSGWRRCGGGARTRPDCRVPATHVSSARSPQLDRAPRRRAHRASRTTRRAARARSARGRRALLPRERQRASASCRVRSVCSVQCRRPPERGAPRPPRRPSRSGISAVSSLSRAGVLADLRQHVAPAEQDAPPFRLVLGQVERSGQQSYASSTARASCARSAAASR